MERSVASGREMGPEGGDREAAAGLGQDSVPAAGLGQDSVPAAGHGHHADSVPADAAHEDGRRVRGDRTKRAILAKAVDIASAEGLEGLSIGRLATELGVSKSGLFAHFGSKLELQLETIAVAGEIFEDEVWGPVKHLEPGLVQLQALMQSWLRYFHDGAFSGGCFFLNAHHEFDSRSGPLHDEIAKQKRRWMEAIVHHVAMAQKRGQIRPDLEPEQLAFELDASGVLANSLWQLNKDGRAFERAATAIRTRLEAAATDAGRQALLSR